MTALSVMTPRASLLDRELKIRQSDGHITATTLADDEAYAQALATYFGLRLPAEAMAQVRQG